MSAPLLLTRSKALADYWRGALGADAGWLTSLSDLPATGEGALWLDLASLSDDEHAADWPALCQRWRVVALSSVPDDAEGMAWLQRGAVGYAHAYSTGETLRQVDAAVAAGGAWLGRSLLLRMCRSFGGLVPPAAQAGWRRRVSAREAEVIDSLKKGLSNKEIARELDIAERTVKAHLTAIFQKFEVEDRLQLLLKLTRIG
ncbi:helix-turn-helix transcriptional regulator [Xenophilus sp. AP218F]|nr:response regulator transcription factor [Chromobacterium sp. ASV5]OWY41118.1 helix-turn-helix transcriptional regulator [Xenophilus sp. AP218F]